MGEYSLNLSAMNGAALVFLELAQNLARLSEETGQIAANTEVHNLSEQHIRNSINYAAEQLMSRAEEFKRCGTILQNCLQRYEAAENRILSGNVPISGTLHGNSSSGTFGGSLGSVLFGTTVYGAQNEESSGEHPVHEGSSGNFWENHVTTESTGLEWNSVEHTLEGSVSASTQIAGEGVSWEHGAASWGAGTAAAEASLQAGLDQVGSIPLPHLEASAGLSACMLQAGMTGSIANEMVGIEGHGEVTAGKVDANVNAELFLLQGEGGLNPTASVGGTVEALVGEATAGVTANLFGVGVTAEGSVSFGAGAHATAGFANGVFSYDVGMALGPGGSVHFEVDLGPIWGAILSEAESVIGYDAELFKPKV